MVLVDPRGRQDVVPVSVKQVGPGKFRCEYVPREPGLHSVNILFAGRPIPNSPYGVNVASCMSKRQFSYQHCRSSTDNIRDRLTSNATSLMSTIGLSVGGNGDSFSAVGDRIELVVDDIFSVGREEMSCLWTRYSAKGCAYG